MLSQKKYNRTLVVRSEKYQQISVSVLPSFQTGSATLRDFNSSSYDEFFKSFNKHFGLTSVKRVKNKNKNKNVKNRKVRPTRLGTLRDPTREE